MRRACQEQCQTAECQGVEQLVGRDEAHFRQCPEMNQSTVKERPRVHQRRQHVGDERERALKW